MAGKTKLSKLKIDLKAKLTAEMRNRLAKVMEDEFTNQSTKYQEKNRQEKAAVVEQWKKEKGFAKLKKKLDDAEAKVTAAKTLRDQCRKEMSDIGLSTSGEVDYNVTYYGGRRAPEASGTECPSKELSRRLRTISSKMEAPTTRKNKLQARLAMAVTIGEGMCVIQEVMGDNDIWPPISDEDIKQLTYDG
jgi:hypothetical protein